MEIALPLRGGFSSAMGTITERRTVLVGIDDGERIGWGEAAPYPGLSPDTAEIAWGSLVRASAGVLDGLSPGALSPSAAAAVDEARRDLAARRAGNPLWRSLGGIAAAVEASVAIGLAPTLADLLERVGSAVADGYRAVKLKVSPGRDVPAVEAIAGDFPDLAIGIDANGAYEDPADPDLLRIARRVRYVEQPFPAADLESHRRLRSSGAVVVLDESITSPASAREALQREAADVVTVKPGRLGIAGCLEVLATAAEAGAGVKASSLLESGVGRAHTLAVATLDGIVLADIAASDRYFAADPWAALITVSDGFATPSPRPGTGAEIDTAAGRRRIVLPRSRPAGET